MGGTREARDMYVVSELMMLLQFHGNKRHVSTNNDLKARIRTMLGSEVICESLWG